MTFPSLSFSHIYIHTHTHTFSFLLCLFLSLLSLSFDGMYMCVCTYIMHIVRSGMQYILSISVYSYISVYYYCGLLFTNVQIFLFVYLTWLSFFLFHQYSVYVARGVCARAHRYVPVDWSVIESFGWI